MGMDEGPATNSGSGLSEAHQGRCGPLLQEEGALGARQEALRGSLLQDQERSREDPEHVKKCTKCSEIKFLNDFNLAARGALGRDSVCKLCKKKYRESTKNRRSQYGKKWRQDNAEKIKNI